MRLAAGAGVAARENTVLTPLTVPAGTSSSANTAVEPAALSVFTVAFRPLTRFVRFVTFVESPLTELVTVVSELVSAVTMVLRVLKLVVRPVMELP